MTGVRGVFQTGAARCVAGITSLAYGCTAVAQDHDSLETVTVWAQKRPAALQEVPAALSALSGSDLSTAGIDGIEAVAEHVPGFDLQKSVGPVTTTLRIRRIGNLGNIPTFEPAVGLFVDGAFRSRSLLATGQLLDVERIEVLSGPQTTLYGKNVGAGVVAVYTEKPAEHFTGEGELTGGWVDWNGTSGIADAKVSLSGPISRDLRAGLAAGWSSHEPTLRNALAGAPDGNDLARTTLRGQLLWSPNDQLEVRLLAGYLHEQDNQGESDVYLAPGARSTGIAATLQQVGGVAPCPDNVPRNRTTCSVATNELDLEAVDLTLIGEYELANGWKLSSITGWDRYEDRRTEDDVVQLFAPLLFFRDSEEGMSLQEELRLASSDESRIAWLTGLFLYRNEYERGLGGKRPMFGPNGSLAFDPIWRTFLNGLPLALPGQLGIHDSQLDTEYLGVFGQVSWPIGERFSLTTGLRWQTEEKRGSIANSVTQPGASTVSVVFTPSVSPGGAPVNGTLERSTDNVTWSLTPQYRFSDALMGWLTVARGAKSGGFNTGFGNAPLSAREFGDERSDHYEIGTRATVADERARFSASVFYTVYHDYQDAAFIASQFTVGNVPRVELQGAELEGRALIGEHTSVDLAISYADLKYANNTTGMCYPGRVPDGSLPQSCNLRGEHPIDAPPWSISAGLQHTRPVSWGELFARLDWSWTDRYNTSFSADPRLIQQPYHDVGLRLGTRVGDAYEIVLWGDNLLDETVTVIDSVLNLFNDASYQSYFTEPRSYGATLRVRF